MAQDTQAMPGAERDGDSGQYTETYPREAFLEAVGSPGDMTGTQDVADEVGCSYESAYKKLRALADEGVIESRKVANARVWFAEGDTQPAPNARETRGTPAAATEEHSPDSIREAAVAAIEDNWKQSWEGHREAAVESLVGLYNRLDELPDGQQKADFLNMYPEFEGPYPSDEYPDADSEKGAWWREFVTECLDDLPGIERHGQNGRRWRNVDTDQ